MNNASPSTCPVCRRPSEILLLDLTLGKLEREFIRRLNPFWEDREGICARCVDAFTVSARRIQEKQARRGRVFRRLERFHLSREEHSRWHQVSPNITKVRRGIIDHIAKRAQDDGAEAWVGAVDELLEMPTAGEPGLSHNLPG